MYKLDRRNAVRDRIVDAEVRKLEIRQARMRHTGPSHRLLISQPDARRW
jgi:hypothetical protein